MTLNGLVLVPLLSEVKYWLHKHPIELTAVNHCDETNQDLCYELEHVEQAPNIPEEIPKSVNRSCVFIHLSGPLHEVDVGHWRPLNLESSVQREKLVVSALKTKPEDFVIWLYFVLLYEILVDLPPVGPEIRKSIFHFLFYHVLSVLVWVVLVLDVQDNHSHLFLNVSFFLLLCSTFCKFARAVFELYPQGFHPRGWVRAPKIDLRVVIQTEHPSDNVLCVFHAGKVLVDVVLSAQVCVHALCWSANPNLDRLLQHPPLEEGVVVIDNLVCAVHYPKRKANALVFQW